VLELKDRGNMLNLDIERIGEVAIVECNGRIVRSEAAFRLRRTVTSLGEARVIVLDLSGVSAIEGGGLGMLIFLQRWTCDRRIELKLFNPTSNVRDRLALVSAIRGFDIASPQEMTSLLANADRCFARAA
jgi:anti-anti-sigma regulatory factor